MGGPFQPPPGGGGRNPLTPDIQQGPPGIVNTVIAQQIIQQLQAIAKNLETAFSSQASGDVSGNYPGPLQVIATHLAAPLALLQGGTGNTTGQPSGSAGGDLTGDFPSPVVSQIAGTAVAVGAWTPALAFGGASTGITYGVGGQQGTAIRLGKFVFAIWSITLTSKGSASGSATIGGLPATAGALAGGALITSHANMASSNVFECQVPNGGASIALGKGNAGSSASLADTDFNNNTSISGIAAYIST